MHLLKALLHSNGIFRRPQGMTLVEVLLGFGLLAIVGLSFAQMFSGFFKSQSQINLRHSGLLIELNLAELLGDPANCTRSFAGFDPATNPTPTEILNNEGERAYEIGQVYEEGTLRLTALQMTNFRPRSTVGSDQYRGQADLFITFEPTDPTLRTTATVRKLTLGIDLEGFTGGVPATQIARCFAMGNDVNVPWVRTTLPPPGIMFMGNKVGIGTLSVLPQQKLHITDGNLWGRGLYTPSDSRLKSQFKRLSDSPYLDSAEPVEYEWSQGTTRKWGFLAQQLEKLGENFTQRDQNAILSANYSQLIPLLIADLQRLHQAVQTQELLLQEQELTLHKVRGMLQEKALAPVTN